MYCICYSNTKGVTMILPEFYIDPFYVFFIKTWPDTINWLGHTHAIAAISTTESRELYGWWYRHK
jgi:hypothetical protein